MNILFFMENNQKGGMDTFFLTLVKHWPNKSDQFVLVCNASHPGIETLKTGLARRCDIEPHDIPISWVLLKKYLFFLPENWTRILQPLLRLLLYQIQINSMKKLFSKISADTIFVINGGYPGGESCRLANIAWYSLNGRKGIHNFHNLAAKPRAGTGFIENYLDKKTQTSVSQFITVSKAAKQSMAARDNFTGYDKIKHIYNGVSSNIHGDTDYGKFNLRQYRDIGKKKILICLANYEPRKGHEFILNAYQLVLFANPNVVLIFAGGGEGAYKRQIEKMADERFSNGDVHFFGFLSNSKDLINQADVLLIGSQRFESFGLTAVEAMSLGKPVVSTSVGGLVEVIGEDEAAGFLVDQNDPLQFSEKILVLLSCPKLRKKMGIAGKKRIKKLFEANSMAENYFAEVHKNRDQR